MKTIFCTYSDRIASPLHSMGHKLFNLLHLLKELCQRNLFYVQFGLLLKRYRLEFLR